MVTFIDLDILADVGRLERFASQEYRILYWKAYIIDRGISSPVKIQRFRDIFHSKTKEVNQSQVPWGVGRHCNSDSRISASSRSAVVWNCR
jgi:hypothetical protein